MRLQAIDDSAIVVIYGRWRVGKTELIEQFYRERQIIKLEGLENKLQLQQIKHVLYQLSQYLGDNYIASLALSTWVEVFYILKKSSGWQIINRILLVN